MNCLPFAILAAAAAFASPAAAADFAGARIELQAGWDRSGIDGEEEDGVVYGAGAGYDAPISDRATIGVEANVNFATTDIAVGGGELQARRDLEGSVRLGFKVNDQTLLYGKAGYANVGVRARAFGIATSDELDGLRVGIGTEYAYRDSGFFKIEYRYSNYQSGFERSQLLFAVGTRF